jgi:hypothetical protein
MSRMRRLVLGAVAVLGIVVPVSTAWACVAPASLTTVNPKVQPGGVVRVIGRETGPGAPIEIHLDAANGPLLTTVTGQPGGMTSRWEWDVPIPANIPYGTHVLYSVENYRNMNATIPKATIYVGVEPPPGPVPDARAGSLDVGSGPSGASLALIVLGVAAGGLLVAGGLTVLAGSNGRSNPAAESVKSS